MRALLFLISALLPATARARWREEWLAELERGGWRMLPGALPDAWMMWRLQTRASAQRRSKRRLHPLQAVDQDFRYAFRNLVARKAFSLSVILSLAVGIATTSASFGFLHTVMSRPFPGVADQDRAARVTVNRGCGWPGCWISSTNPEEARALMRSFRSFEGVAASASARAAMIARGEATSLRAAVVSTNYFDVLGVAPSLGRGFRPEEDEPAQADVAIIGQTLWQRSFGADAGALGSFVRVNGRAVQIVGVAPAAFGGTSKGNMEPAESLASRCGCHCRSRARSFHPKRFQAAGRCRRQSTSSATWRG